ncbi:MAG: T9SS type A sorting domain-containing protein [Bacteroidota bacterium]
MNVCVEDYAQGKSYSFDADTLSPERQVYARLFPNPNNGEGVMLAYDFLSDEQVNVQIFEVSGKKAHELTNLKGGMNELHLDLSNLDSGIYLVNVFTVSERQTIRLVIH